MTEPEQRSRLRELLAHRPLEVDLELTLERRVRAYAHRLNHRLAWSGDTDVYDTSKDSELAQVVMLLCEAALDGDEQAVLPQNPRRIATATAIARLPTQPNR